MSDGYRSPLQYGALFGGSHNFASIGSVWSRFDNPLIDIECGIAGRDEPIITHGDFGLFETGQLDWEFCVRCLVCGYAVDRMNLSHVVSEMYGPESYLRHTHPFSCKSLGIYNVDGTRHDRWENSWS